MLKSLLLTGAASVLLLSAQSAAAEGQPETPAAGPSSPGVQIGEIVVTARRRAENLQDVPISITALSGEALQQAGIRNATELQYRTPSLTVTSGGQDRTTVSYAIRGQRSNETQLLTAGRSLRLRERQELGRRHL